MPPRRIPIFTARDLYALSDSARAKNHPFFADGLDFSGDQIRRLECLADWLEWFGENLKHFPDCEEIFKPQIIAAIVRDILNGGSERVDAIFNAYADEFNRVGPPGGVNGAP